jgi:hypothetical protein
LKTVVAERHTVLRGSDDAMKQFRADDRGQNGHSRPAPHRQW